MSNIFLVIAKGGNILHKPQMWRMKDIVKLEIGKHIKLLANRVIKGVTSFFLRWLAPVSKTGGGDPFFFFANEPHVTNAIKYTCI